MHDPLRLQLLGGFTVAGPGGEVPGRAWRLRKAKSVVKLLALAPERRLHRDVVVELLWPDRDRDAAANNLHQAVYQARRALEAAGPGIEHGIERRDELLLLWPDADVEIDLLAFESAAAAARELGTIDAHRAALALDGGELLPEDRFAEWAAARRATVRELRLGLRLGLADLLDAEGDGSGAIETLRQALLVDALHEPTHRALMLRLAAAGRPQEALAQWQELRRALQREFAAEPDAETRRLYRELLAQGAAGAEPAAADPASAPAQLGGQPLPLQLTSFVGRRREVGDVQRLLDRTRLLTLTGAGGCGKTRLSLEAASAVEHRFPAGVRLCELAPLHDGTLVPQAVAGALGLDLPPGADGAQLLAAALGDRRALLVLDNCEHLVSAVAGCVEVLLRACPGLVVLATSREPLRIAGEVVWRVPSLSLPEPDAGPEQMAADSEAVRLFCARAADASPGFALDASNAEAIAQLCRRLDGMPLALELAAARTAALAPAQIVERLEQSLRVLGTGPRDALDRQRTLAATLAWSHDLLDDAERVLYRRLGAFAGAFTMESCEAVCAGDGLPAADVLDVLGRLVDKSLVTIDEGRDEYRYRLLETIREHARGRLAEAGETAALRLRHRDHYLALAELGAPGPPPLERLEPEHDDLRHALAGAQRDAPDVALRLAVRLSYLWLARGHFTEGSQRLYAALEGAPAPTTLRAEALLAACSIDIRRGVPTRIRAMCTEALEIAEAHGDGAATAEAVHQLGLHEWLTGKPAAQAQLERAVGLARSAGAAAVEAAATHTLAVLANTRSDYGDARELLLRCQAQLAAIDPAAPAFFSAVSLGLPSLMDPGWASRRILFEETLLLFRRVGCEGALAHVDVNLAWVERAEGDHDAAVARLEGAVAAYHRLDDHPGAAVALAALGNAERSAGLLDRAREHLEQALELRRELGDVRGTGMARGALGLVASAAGDHEHARAELGAALAGFERTADGPGAAGMRQNLASVALDAGEPEIAQALLEEVYGLWGGQQLLRACAWNALMLADLAAARGDDEHAQTWAARGAQLFGELGDSTGAALCEAVHSSR